MVQIIQIASTEAANVFSHIKKSAKESISHREKNHPALGINCTFFPQLSEKFSGPKIPNAH